MLDGFYPRKKEEFDALADTVIGMPVGEMEKTIQTTWKHKWVMKGEIRDRWTT